MKKIVFASVLALMLGACASKSTKESCACGMDKPKAACSGECSVKGDCAGCKEKKAEGK
ncbi:hypothetical protein ACLVWU_10585 [Bdellovibrio sp. HCB290]|uniref:hypothetical protein n=1 Tax=Bdellovibrio sp. HCB290 TaxID=3394356 RepID=UPI0039B5F57D